MKWISFAATVFGTVSTMTIVPLHGVLNIMTKHHVLMFVKIINFN
nr:MAG TPA: hypothetical protein [Caudoviricetes sp.]